MLHSTQRASRKGMISKLKISTRRGKSTEVVWCVLAVADNCGNELWWPDAIVDCSPREWRRWLYGLGCTNTSGQADAKCEGRKLERGRVKKEKWGVWLYKWVMEIQYSSKLSTPTTVTHTTANTQIKWPVRGEYAGNKSAVSESEVGRRESVWPIFYAPRFLYLDGQKVTFPTLGKYHLLYRTLPHCQAPLNGRHRFRLLDGRL